MNQIIHDEAKGARSSTSNKTPLSPLPDIQRTFDRSEGSTQKPSQANKQPAAGSLFQNFQKSSQSKIDIQNEILKNNPNISASQLFQMQKSGMSMVEIMGKIQGIVSKMEETSGVFEGEEEQVTKEKRKNKKKRSSQRSTASVTSESSSVVQATTNDSNQASSTKKTLTQSPSVALPSLTAPSPKKQPLSRTISDYAQPDQTLNKQNDNENEDMPTSSVTSKALHLEVEEPKTSELSPHCSKPKSLVPPGISERETPEHFEEQEGQENVTPTRINNRKDKLSNFKKQDEQEKAMESGANQLLKSDGGLKLAGALSLSGSPSISGPLSPKAPILPVTTSSPDAESHPKKVMQKSPPEIIKNNMNENNSLSSGGETATITTSADKNQKSLVLDNSSTMVCSRTIKLADRNENNANNADLVIKIGLWGFWKEKKRKKKKYFLVQKYSKIAHCDSATPHHAVF